MTYTAGQQPPSAHRTKIGRLMPDSTIKTNETQVLAGQLRKEIGVVDGAMQSLYTRCQARAEFTGSLQVAYEDHLTQWKQGQARMVEHMQSLATMLDQLATNIDGEMKKAADAVRASVTNH